MAKKGGKETEGLCLLGHPTFEEIDNRRLRCVETGHELPAKEADFYAKTKACRLALVDFALARKKPPLNMFMPDPLSKSKLICKLTGDTVNKTEEHIWKHITGRRFLNKLKQKEEAKLEPEAIKKTKKFEKESSLAVEGDEKSQKSKAGLSGSRKSQKRNKSASDYLKSGTKSIESAFEEVEGMVVGDDLEEPDFWMPPVGDRWDCDDGKDRWAPRSSSEGASQKEDESGTAADLSARTKRMSIAVGASSSASRKKKSRKNENDGSNAT